MITAKEKAQKKPYIRYVITAYLTFWLMVLVLCGGASMVFHASPLVMRWLSDLCAWSPTIVLFVLFSKLQSGKTKREFFQQNFSGRLRPTLIVGCIVIVTGIFFLSAWFVSLWTKVSFSSLFSIGTYPIWLSILLSICSGPTGEECGWRGYLRYELQDRFGFVKGNVLLGVIWAFWHTVLWFVDNEYTTGMELVIYIIANVIVITALNIIMAIVLERENNLFYAVLIHFCFNLPYCFLLSGIEFYVVMSVLYFIAATVLVLLRKKSITW